MRLPLTLWLTKAGAGHTPVHRAVQMPAQMPAQKDACAICGGGSFLDLRIVEGDFCEFCGLVCILEAGEASEHRRRIITAHMNRSDKLLQRFKRFRAVTPGGEVLIIAEMEHIPEQAVRDVTMGFGMKPNFLHSLRPLDGQAAQIYCLFSFERSSAIDQLAQDLAGALRPGGVILVETLLARRRTISRAKELGVHHLLSAQNLSHLMERHGCQLIHQEISWRHPIASLLYRKASF